MSVEEVPVPAERGEEAVVAFTAALTKGIENAIVPIPSNGCGCTAAGVPGRRKSRPK